MDEGRKSEEATAVPRDPTRKWKNARKWSLIWLGCIAVVSLIGLTFAWLGHPASNTLRYELAKTFMQVLAVAFLGGIATIATFNFQNSRAQENEDTRRAEDKEERRRERSRRKLEIARDERRRQDDQLRSIMEETLKAYNRVKRIRRLLEAETNDGASGYLTLEPYDRYMVELINEQLTFERLKRFTPFISDERLNPALDAAQPQTSAKSQTLTKSSLEKSYRGIEDYLNDVIGEYQEKRHTVRDEVSVSLAEFPCLRGFIGGEFTAHAAKQLDKLIDDLLKALWQPLDNPAL